MDDCGGWGDRLAGLAGAAMLAVTTGRKLRIDWPGLDKVVTPNQFWDWRYDPAEVNLTRASLDYIASVSIHSGSRQGLIFPDDGDEEVAFLNHHNDNHAWTRVLDGDHANHHLIKAYRVIFLHVNRGLSRGGLALFEREYGVLGQNDYASTMERKTTGCYSCIWQTVFLAPSHRMLDNIPLHMTYSNTTTLRDAVDKFMDPAVCSIGYAFRIDDTVVSAPLPPNLRGCVTRLAETYCRNYSVYSRQKRVFVFSTNSLQASLEAAALLSDDFDEIFSTSRQLPMRHINVMAFTTAMGMRHARMESVANSALELAVADWFMLASVDVLVVSVGSGFSSSAALYSHRGTWGRQQQVLISNDEECGLLHPDALHSERFF
jgi:hypothetical protein